MQNFFLNSKKNKSSKDSSKIGLNWMIGAGIVGADIGTSVFYSTGILFPLVGFLAPLLILFVCIMMWLFKLTYQEGLALSPYNGGAYSMILRSIGRRASVLAGALTFISYLATAAVSSISGAHYLSSLFPTYHFNDQLIILISFIPIILFGILNTRGIKEPAKIVTVIAFFHFFLLIIIVLWGSIYLIFNINNVNWNKFIEIIPNGKLSFQMLIYGLASAFLGITGFESAAQIVEELSEPINKTVKKLYTAVVILVSLTAPLISFLCLIILNTEEIQNNKEFLLSGLCSQLGGKPLLYVIVIDATLTLFAAVNTAFVGFIGLASTMAKQGNLPPILITRLEHKYNHIQGYPFITVPFIFITMFMTIIVTGKVETLAEVYGMAFLGVMLSFCIGVVLMRNRNIRKGIPLESLSNIILQTKKRIIPLIPLISGLILGLAQLILILFAPYAAKNMLIELFSLVILIMAFYRWGVLEKRLETRDDLRLGLGKFKSYSDLPNDLPKYVVCVGGTAARKLIVRTINAIFKELNNKAFELIVFHAEEDKDYEGFESELLQRVISQQIAPIYDSDFIIRVKLMPGSLIEGLLTFKKSCSFTKIFVGGSKDINVTKTLRENLTKELEVDVTHIS